MNLLRVPKVRMVLVLSALSLAAIATRFSFDLVFRLFAILAATLLTEFLLWKIRGVEPFLPSAGVVTSLIVFLLSEPSVPLYLPVLAALFGVAGKQLFRFWGNHTLNPAAAGLFVSSYLGNVISWWGPNSGLLAFLIIIFGASFVSLVTVRQWWIVLPFLAITILISHGLGQLEVGAFWFFALVMLPEPMTAAKGPITKPFYGALVGLLPFLVARLSFISDPLIASLLLGNSAFKFVDKLWGK